MPEKTHMIKGERVVIEKVDTLREIELMRDAFGLEAKMGDWIVTYEDRKVEVWSEEKIKEYL